MSDFINYLQHRVEEVKRDLQDAVDRAHKANEDRGMFEKELQGYEQALSAEMRRQGWAASTVQSDAQERLPLNGEQEDIEEGPNKAEFARQFFREHAESGVTPNDLFVGFQEAGIPIKKPYIYSLIQRLHTSKPPAIRSKRGKWFPVPESESEQSDQDGKGYVSRNGTVI
jgi:hypothetical protein